MKKFFTDLLEILHLSTPTPEFVPEIAPKKTVTMVIESFSAVISDLEEVATTAAKEQAEAQEQIAMLTKQIGESQNEQDKATAIAINLRKILDV